MFRTSLLLTIALVPSGCRKGGAAIDAPAPIVPKPDAAPRREIIRLGQISIEVQAWPAKAGEPPDERGLAGRIWEGLAQSSAFEAVGRRPLADAGPGERHRRARLKVIYGVEAMIDDSKRSARGILRGAATLTVDWADDLDGPELWDNVACDGDLPADDHDLPGLAVTLVECALERGARGLIDKEAVRSGTDATVLGALESSDPSLRQIALGTLAERHLTQAVPRLLELLHSPDVLVRDGAIGALVALREPRAVRPLTELVQFRDLDMMRRIIDAVGAIGGDEARAYLELVASGHEVPIIRELAEQALSRLLRRAADAAP